MKKIFLAGTFLMLITITFNNSVLAKVNKNETTLTFNVSMDCHSCVQKIEGNIPYEKGVKDLKVSLDNKECVVTFRTDQTSTEKIIKAFDKLGYKAEVKKDKKDNEHINQSENMNNTNNIKH